MRNWIREVKLDEQGRAEKVIPFLDHLRFLHPVELEIGPDGCIYIIEFGTAWEKNPDSQIVRIEYTGAE